MRIIFLFVYISGHITFDEFLYVFALLALAMTTSISIKYGVSLKSIANSDCDMVKALLQRMYSCPGIMTKKMRCFSKFKHTFQGNVFSKMILVLSLYHQTY